MPHFFFFPPILDSTEARAFLFCDFLEYCPRGEKKFVPFSCICFSGGSLCCFWCTWTCYECSKWYELFASCNVFCMQAWHFRNFQIRASLWSPCHYIFRAYTTKNLQGQQPTKMKALRSTEMSVTLHQSRGRNFHQHLGENIMSYRIEDRAGPSYRIWRVF